MRMDLAVISAATFNTQHAGQIQLYRGALSRRKGSCQV